MGKIKTVLFDLNGTIFDDFHVWEAAKNKTFSYYEKVPPTAEEYFSEMKKDYMEIYRSRGINATREEINAIYIPEYNRLAHTATIFQSAFNTLCTLKRKGVNLGLLTLQPKEMVTPLLEKFFLDDIFDEAHSEFHCKNKAEAIVQIAKANNTGLEHFFFMGDTPSDITQGKEARVRTAVFLPGHLPLHLFEENPPHHVFTVFSQILMVA